MRLRNRFKPRLLVMYALAIGLLAVARPTPQTLILGLIPILAGEGLRLWATLHLHKTESLTMTGPYAYLRNPLYLGTLLIGLGFAICASSPLAYVALAISALGFFVYYMPYKDRIEGARLESLFGDAYRRYHVAVPSLLPRLHPYVPLGSDAPERPDFAARFRDNNELGTATAVGLGVLALCLRWAII